MSSMVGSEVKLCESNLSRILFESFLDDISYCQVYEHPTKWDNDGKRVKDEQFLPLLMNRAGGIVSYLWLSKSDIILVLPRTKRKRELLQKVMQEFVFKYFSEYFPEVEESLWLNQPTYYLPRQEELLKEKEELIAKYNESLAVFWKSHATLTLLATQDLPTFGYNMIDPLKSWCWGSILFYPFKISRFS